MHAIDNLKFEQEKMVWEHVEYCDSHTAAYSDKKKLANAIRSASTSFDMAPSDVETHKMNVELLAQIILADDTTNLLVDDSTTASTTTTTTTTNTPTTNPVESGRKFSWNGSWSEVGLLDSPPDAVIIYEHEAFIVDEKVVEIVFVHNAEDSEATEGLLPVISNRSADIVRSCREWAYEYANQGVVFLFAEGVAITDVKVALMKAVKRNRQLKTLYFTRLVDEFKLYHALKLANNDKGIPTSTLNLYVTKKFPRCSTATPELSAIPSATKIMMNSLHSMLCFCPNDPKVATMLKLNTSLLNSSTGNAKCVLQYNQAIMLQNSHYYREAVCYFNI